MVGDVSRCHGRAQDQVWDVPLGSHCEETQGSGVQAWGGFSFCLDNTSENCTCAGQGRHPRGPRPKPPCEGGQQEAS